MPVKTVALRKMRLPAFGEPTVMPVIPRTTYERRVEALHARMRAERLDAAVVYGDREHAANLAFLSGYDPRFEEALLIVAPGRAPRLLVGNEGWGYAELCDGPYERVLFQTFSLPGQDRSRSPALPDILSDAGLRSGQRVGAIGWKPITRRDPGLDETALDLPAFIADALRALVGASGAVVNAADLLMSPADGLRATLDVDQLALMEFSASFTSQGVRNVLHGVEPGMTELQAARLLGMNGLPHNCHPMLSAGRRAKFGLPSPGMDVIRRGDPITTAYGVHGALNARAGFLVENARELPSDIQDYVERLVAPYFSAAVDWLQTVGVGVTGGQLWQAVHDRIGDPFFGVGLNPGHLIGLDEWMHSPVEKGSTVPIRSGMALQADIIPATGTDYFTSNVEDGVAVADEALREEFASRYPEAWGRIEARRAFMADEVGVRLKPELLPFSNIPAFLPPFWLARDMAMAVEKR